MIHKYELFYWTFGNTCFNGHSQYRYKGRLYYWSKSGSYKENKGLPSQDFTSDWLGWARMSVEASWHALQITRHNIGSFSFISSTLFFVLVKLLKI